jgi:hypothetical protein
VFSTFKAVFKVFIRHFYAAAAWQEPSIGINFADAYFLFATFLRNLWRGNYFSAHSLFIIKRETFRLTLFFLRRVSSSSRRRLPGKT